MPTINAHSTSDISESTYFIRDLEMDYSNGIGFKKERKKGKNQSAKSPVQQKDYKPLDYQKEFTPCT